MAARKLWLCPLLLGLVFFADSLLAAAPGYTWAYRQDGFRFDAILSVASLDFDGDGRDELAISGRDYQERQACLEIFRWEDKALNLVWRSPNLLESESSLLALPVIWPEGPALIGLTKTHYYAFARRESGYAEITRGPIPFPAEEAASGDLDGDGCDELIVAVTMRNTKDGRDKNLRVLFWRDGALAPGAVSAAIGNVRSMAAGDLDGDGLAEVAAEVGARTSPGQFRFLRLTDAGLKETAILKSNMPAAAYGLAVGRQYPEPGRFLFAASQPGRLCTYAYGLQGPAAGLINLSFQGSPVALCAGDLDGDGRHELALAGYPARMQILQAAAPPIVFKLNGQAKILSEPMRVFDGAVYAEARSLAAALGWETRAGSEPSRIDLLFFGADGVQHTLAIDAALSAAFDGQATAVPMQVRTLRGYIYLPVKDLAGLAGYRADWDPERCSLTLDSGGQA